MNDSITTETAVPELEQIRAIPLFAKCDPSGLQEVSRGLSESRVRRGEILFRQGSDADSAFFVRSGVLEVLSALPGGGEIHLARLGPGSTLGETSLVACAIRSASVRAETDIYGFTMERRFFQAALAQGNRTATCILRQLLRTVSERLQRQYEMLVDSSDTVIPPTGCNEPGKDVPVFADAARPCDYPFLSFLPRLGFFSEFSPDEIRALVTDLPIHDLPRGTRLFGQNEAPASAFFVVRGAVQLCRFDQNCAPPLTILGPGSFLGTTEIIAGGNRVAYGRVREAATILELDAGKLREWLSASSPVALKFQQALCESLIADLGKINKRVTRMRSCQAVRMN